LNEAVIESVSDSLLAEIASVLLNNPQIKRIRIEGHASAEGDSVANEKLSEARAKAVREHLIQRGGVPSERLESKGFGAKRPIASNDNDEGREKNRRVEFNIVEQATTVERVESKRSRSGDGALAGLFFLARPVELGFLTTSPGVTTLSFQLGIGYAF
jgi:OOP family OmpA-OmpF porin